MGKGRVAAKSGEILRARVLRQVALSCFWFQMRMVQYLPRNKVLRLIFSHREQSCGCFAPSIFWSVGCGSVWMHVVYISLRFVKHVIHISRRCCQAPTIALP